MSPRARSLVGLAAWLLLCYLVALIGAMASIEARTFYAQLEQPAWAPPGWLFGPVWTTLFAMMGVAAWLVWREGGFAERGRALGLFIAQLAVNGLWSWLFFAWKLGALALADIGVLWLLLVATLAMFWKVHRAAGLLLVPYLLWISFAAMLNYSVWQLNPVALGGL